MRWLGLLVFGQFLYPLPLLLEHILQGALLLLGALQVAGDALVVEGEVGAVDAAVDFERQPEVLAGAGEHGVVEGGGADVEAALAAEVEAVALQAEERGGADAVFYGGFDAEVAEGGAALGVVADEVSGGQIVGFVEEFAEVDALPGAVVEHNFALPGQGGVPFAAVEAFCAEAEGCVAATAEVVEAEGVLQQGFDLDVVELEGGFPFGAAALVQHGAAFGAAFVHLHFDGLGFELVGIKVQGAVEVLDLQAGAFECADVEGEADLAAAQGLRPILEP